jgi:hypothetical protein
MGGDVNPATFVSCWLVVGWGIGGVANVRRSTQVWLQTLFRKSCLRNSRRFRERGIITVLWSLMYTEGFATATYVFLLRLPSETHWSARPAVVVAATWIVSRPDRCIAHHCPPSFLLVAMVLLLLLLLMPLPLMLPLVASMDWATHPPQASE